MGGLGFVLGGALQGIGQGIATQAQSNIEERRKLALEDLRHRNQLTEDEHKATQQDWVNGRQTARQTSSQIVVDKAKTGNDIALEGVRASNAQALERLQQNLTLSRELQVEGAKLANDLAKMGKEVGDYRVAADGSIWAYSKTGAVLGNSKPGKFNPTAQGRGLGSGSTLDSLDLGDGAPTPAPTGTPTPTKPTSAPAAPAAPSTGRGIQRPRAGNRGTPAEGEKTYTVADAQATATKNNVTIEEVHRRMRNAGYKLTGN